MASAGCRLSFLLRTICTFCILHCNLVTSDGIFSLKLVDYANPKHLLTSGECCEETGMRSDCKGSCDNYFIICFSKQMNGSCSYGKYWTDDTATDKYTFPTYLYGVSPFDIANPIKVPFKKWTGVMYVKIDVFDNDYTVDSFNHPKNAFVDSLFIKYETSDIGSKDITLKQHKFFPIRGKVATMNIGMSVNCKSGYLIPTCEEYCTDRDDNLGHYTCDFKAGKKICRNGWYGQNCISSVPVCSPRDDSSGHYNCNKTTDEKICLPGWKNVKLNCTEELKTSISSLVLVTSSLVKQKETTRLSSLTPKTFTSPQSFTFTSERWFVKSSTKALQTEAVSLPYKVTTDIPKYTSHKLPNTVITRYHTPSSFLVTPTVQATHAHSHTFTGRLLATSSVTKPEETRLYRAATTCTTTVVIKQVKSSQISKRPTDINNSSEGSKGDNFTILNSKQRKSLIFSATIGPVLVLLFALIIFVARVAYRKKRKSAVSPIEEPPEADQNESDKNSFNQSWVVLRPNQPGTIKKSNQKGQISYQLKPIPPPDLYI